jgi:hypothetical protein
MVPRQHDWKVGDAFHPVSFSNGEPAVREIALRKGGIQQTIEFAAAEILLPGAYDFIVRPVRYGFEEDELLAVLPSDITGPRRAGVVIRVPYVIRKFWNKIQVSGRSVQGLLLSLC